MKYEIETLTDWKDKRFSFLPTRKERKGTSTHFGTLPFACHTSQRLTKVKEPNLPTALLQLFFFVNLQQRD